jgi:hypothetical protein
MCLRPRFADLARILYLLSRFAGRHEEELLPRCLDHLRLLNSDLPGFVDALHELWILRVVETCSSLPWLCGEGNEVDGFDIANSLAMAADCLRDDRAALGLA